MKYNQIVSFAAFLVGVVAPAPPTPQPVESSGVAIRVGGNRDENGCGVPPGKKNSRYYNHYAVVDLGSGFRCGECYEITCQGPAIIGENCNCNENPVAGIKASDHYPMALWNFEVTEEVFHQIVSPEDWGSCVSLNITYKVVECPYEGDLLL
eukprot:Awhi_evm1s10107